MSKLKLKILSKNIAEQMDKIDFTPKQLSEHSGVSYPSLMPILNGTRDCGISKLLAIADALNSRPDQLLKGLYNKDDRNSLVESNPNKLKICAVFISQVKMTYCLVHILSSNQKLETTKNYALQCGMKPNELISDINETINESVKQLNFDEPFNLKNVAVFISAQQYDRPYDKQNLDNQLRKQFFNHILQADYIANYNAFLGKKDGICVSINDGCALTYSSNKGKSITKLLGYGFPISDIAGNFWLGCEAVRYTIRVAENIEQSSTLSDRLLAIYDGNVNALSEAAMQAPQKTFLLACSIVKELHFKQEKSYQILQESSKKLLEYIHIVDKTTKKTLPILLAGELAYLYAEFMPKNRIINSKHEHKLILLSYGSEALTNALNEND